MDYSQKYELYRSIQAKLADKFPEGTVENTEKRKGHIPVQAYIKRLEEAAGPYWSWTTIGDPIIYERDNQVQVKGILKIVDTVREGSGFSNFKRQDDLEQIVNLKYAVSAAESDAIRDACNKYLMGWTDLAPYRQWASNPGVGLLSESTQRSAGTGECCIKCQSPLTAKELQVLQTYNIRNMYCEKDLPQHLLKKRG